MRSCPTDERPPAAAGHGAGDGRRAWPSLRAGLIGAGALATFYVVVVAVSSGSPTPPPGEAGEWRLMAPIVVGFGIQTSLMAELRRRRRLGAAGMAAGGAGTGALTAGMVLCCAPRLADLAPVLGATGAVAFLADRHQALMLAGISVNALVIAVTALRLRRLRPT